MRSSLKFLLSVLTGALLTLGFAPINIALFGLICPLMLWGLIHKSTPMQAFWRFLGFGIGLYGVGVSWVYISIARFGGQPFWVAGLITGLFILILSVYTGILGSLLAHCAKKPWQKIILYPTLWTLFDILRSWILTGFPWLFLGDTQLGTPLQGFAPIGSVYLVSFMTVLLSVLFFQLILERKLRRDGLGILLIGLLGYGLNSISWTQIQTQHPLSITSIQGDIPQSLKWQPNLLENSLLTYQTLSQKALDQHHQILIWPESAIPDTQQDLPRYLHVLNQTLTHSHNSLITGILESQSTPHNTLYFNAALGLGDAHGVYLKEHLVPFGEYIPFQNLFGRLFAWMDIPASGFTPGPRHQTPIHIEGYPVGIMICYEIAYPMLVREHSLHSAFLVSLSDDAWFGDSLGPWQQAQIAQMRALETGRYLINSTNNGITSLINPKGHVIAEIHSHQALALQGVIYPVKGETPWQRF